MINFSYNLGCRDCLNGSGRPHVYALMQGNVVEYQRFTEYEGMKTVEDLRRSSNNRCEFCGSNNVEILDVAVNGYQLYDYDRLIDNCEGKNYKLADFAKFFMVNIDKRSSQVRHNIGGSPRLSRDFLKPTLDRIIDTVAERPDDNFKIHPNGNFFICLSGEYSFAARRELVKVEKFRSAGLSRDEILDQIKALALSYGVTLSVEKFIAPKKSWWQF